MMKLRKGEIKGIKFFYRDGFSDLKTFKEVIENRVYLRRGMTIEKGEKWMDCGGNVGAFTLLACSMGADVTVYEPDPYNCEMIKKNLELNGFHAKIVQKALVHDDRKSVFLFIGNNNNTWRNSIVKKWNNKGLKVDAVNFDSEARNFDCCKMDIEGAEMMILENTKKVFKKLVYEWSFDIDDWMPRLWDVIDKQSKKYSEIKFQRNTIHYDDKTILKWSKKWFPMCTNVFCYKK